MTKNDILDLIQDIARDEADTDAISAYYDEIVEELGKLPDPPMVERDLLTVTSGTATYDYPAAAVELLYYFQHAYQLPHITEETLEAYEITWRDDSGAPRAWKTNEENAREFRLYPNPNITSTALGVGATEPFGEDFPTNMGALIYSDTRESDISDMVGLYITFRVLHKEFVRPSNHQDVAWAMLHQEISDVFYHMGVMRNVKKRERKEAPSA